MSVSSSREYESDGYVPGEESGNVEFLTKDPHAGEEEVEPAVSQC